MSLSITDALVTFPDGDSRITAVNHVNLTVESGEFAAITGPSGSGKSTLLALAGLLLTPDAGTVRLSGEVVSGLKRAQAAKVRREHIGFVFQQSNLLASLTALEQLEIVARYAGHRGQDVRDRAASLLESVDLGNAMDRRPAQLSGGQRQRVGIARALMNSPKLLLVDEPTAALDQERGAQVVELLSRVTRDSGVATLMVTHDLARLDTVDTIYDMVDGVLTERPRRAAAA